MLIEDASELSVPVLCDQCRRLLHDFYQAVREVTELHEQRSTAALDDDIHFRRFGLLIHTANEKKDLAKYAFLRHLGQHGSLTATATG